MTISRLKGHMPRRLLPGLCLALLAFLLFTGWKEMPRHADRNESAAATMYSYYHFKEPWPMRLDASRVAILRSKDARGAYTAQPDLSSYGLDVSAVEPMAVRGWSYVGTASSARTDASVRGAVGQIADGNLVDFVSPVFLDDQGEPIVITPQILVGFDRSLDHDRAEAILAESGAGEILDRDWANMKLTYRLKSASRDGFDVLEAANRLAQRSEVMFAEPDMMATCHQALIPNDPYFPLQWGLRNDGTFGIYCGAVAFFDINATAAWDITTGDPSVIVAILGNGVQQNHPDLNMYTPGFDATGEGSGGDPGNACDNHGTAVAGTVSGIINNGIGIVGVAPGVRSVSVRMIVSSLLCNGSGIIQASWVVDGLAWAEGIGARITNSSWTRNNSDSAIDQKFADTRANGMVHFGAAGNGSTNTISYPASLPSINAVAALSPCGDRADFSNYGTGLAFSAPGHYLTSTDRTGTDGDNDGVDDGGCLPSGVLGCNLDGDCGTGGTCVLVSPDYALVAGTSIAAPYAAGVAALMLSVRPDLTADQVEAVLQQTSTDLGNPGYDTGYGWGMVNAASAVQRAILTGVDDTPPFTPGDFTLRGNRPNPFNAHTSIEYDLMRQSTVQLRIVDVLGRVVRATPAHSESAGPHEFLWDGTDGKGAKMAAGVYFFELRVNGASQVRKGVLLH